MGAVRSAQRRLEVGDHAVAGGLDLAQASVEAVVGAVVGVVDLERARLDGRGVERPQQPDVGGVAAGRQRADRP